MSYSRIYHSIAPLLPRIYEHPFNQGLYHGTLPRCVFRSYLMQDTLYLRDLSQALGLVSQRFSRGLEARQFKFLADEILDTERNLQAKYLGIPTSPRLFFMNKRPIEKIPVIADYTHYLLQSARSGPLEQAVASLVPCFWIYSDLGKKMQAMPAYHPGNPYYLWMRSYSGPQFTAATKSLTEITEKLAKNSSDSIKREMTSALVRSTKYEIRFWDSVCNMNRSTLEHKPARIFKNG